MLTGSFSRTRLLRPTSSNLGRRLSCSRFSVSAVTYKDTDTLAGTVAFHNIYVLLHSRKPPSEHPSKVPSKLQRALQLQAIQWRGLVNFSYLPEQAVHPAQSATDVPEWEDEHGEAYGVTAFSRYRGRLDLPMRVSTENLDEVAATLQAHASQTGPNGLSSHLTGAEREVHIYICTHGQRDCRCGETGGAVYEALRKEVAKRNLSETVKVGSVGHVGGHKCAIYLILQRPSLVNILNRYAANILVFPHGEWYVTLQLLM